MKRLLLLLTMPPPVHGVTVINQQIVNLPGLRDDFAEVRLIPLSFNSGIHLMEKISLSKLLLFGRVLLRLCLSFFFWRKQYVLLSPALKGAGLFRDALMIVLLRMGGATIIHHIHGRGVMEGRTSLVHRLVYRYIFRKSYVICLSELLLGDVIPYVERERVFIVPNGIPDPYGDSDLDMAMAARRGRKKPRILFLSTMMIEKGPLILLQALKYLKDKSIAFEAVFAGHFFTNLSERSFLDRAREMGLQDAVSCIQGVYGHDRDALYLDSDIFVFPTMREAFGLVAIEAMAAALPLVASDEGSLPEIVLHGKTGFVFPKGDAGVLACHLEALCKSPEKRIAFGRDGRERYLAEYSGEAFSRHMLAALRQACQQQV